MAEGQDDDRQDIPEELASLRRQVTEATTNLANLSLRLTQLEDRVREDSGAPQPDPTPEAAIAETQEAVPAAVIPEVSPEVTLEEPAPVAQAASATQSTASSGPDWEFLLGRNWFAIIGGIAIVLGIGFFLKLAFDNNWISDTGRVILGIVVGLAFLGGGEYAQRRVPRWAQAVTASGAAILYLSIYAAFGLYRLIPAELSFILLAVVVTAAVLLALRYESIVIALLGVVGAFISPVLLGTDLPDVRFVLAYILLVDIGILAISAFRNWRWLTLVGWVGSYGIFSYWLIDFPGYDPVFAHLALTGIFLSFAAAMPLYHILWRRTPGAADLTLMTINAAGYSLLTPVILWEDYEGWFGLIAVSLALLYGIFALAAHLRKGVPFTVTVFSLAFASVFLALAFPLQFSGHSVALGWAAQGAATVWLGFYIRRWQTRAFGIAALLLAALHLLLFDLWVDPDAYIAIINLRLVTMAFVIAAFSVTALIYHHYRESEGRLKIEVGAMPAMLGMANLVAIGLLSLEAVNILDADSRRWDSLLDLIERLDRLGNGATVAITTLWAIYGAAVAGVGLLRRYEPARWAGVALLALAVWKLITYDSVNVYIDPQDFTPVLNIRFLCFALVLGLLSALAVRFGRSRSDLGENENILFLGVLIAANAVALWMLSQEVYYYFDSLGARNGADYEDAMHLTLTVLWALYAMAVIGAGIASGHSRVRLAGIALLAVPVAKLFVFDVFLLEMAFRVVAFITLGCLLLGMGLVYQRYSLVVRGFLFGSRSEAVAQDD
ncbi:MAG: DUF2339 domain-containing protein [Chloroflexota bacterium]|nr:DUF2339 domain-containing protein [Chloroflexota bacterium]